jgi:hypothetical protein
MRSFIRHLPWAALVVFAYFLGTMRLFSPTSADAQTEDPKQGLSEQAIEKMDAFNGAMKLTVEILEQDDRYKAVTKGINPWAVSVGGVDAVKDLESGRGVDPVTYAALYAGLALDEISNDIGSTKEGIVTYKGKPVRMYSVAKLKEYFARKSKLAGEELMP